MVLSPIQLHITHGIKMYKTSKNTFQIEYNNSPRCFHINVQFNVTGIFYVKRFISKTDYCVVLIQNNSGKCYFPNLNSLKTLDIINGVDINSLSKEDILSEYRKNRRLIIVKNSDTPWLIKDDYMVSFLTSALEELDICGTTKQSISVDLGYLLKTKCIPKRPIHHTTAETETPTDVDNFQYLGQKLDPNHIALPLGEGEYKKPLYIRENSIKTPVQVSDISTDEYSFKPSLSNFDNQGKATIVTNVSPFSRSSLSSTTFTNGFSENRNAHGHISEQASNNRPNQKAPTNGHTRNKPPRHPKYSNVINRLGSFQDIIWDEREKPKAQILADWGLFATGHGDLVRCFSCGLGLKDWIKDDDPLGEHVKYANECSFLLQELGEDQYRVLKLTVVNPEENGATGNPIGHQNGSIEPGDVGVRNPRYQRMEDRLKSFENFPKYVTQTIRDLAVAGLFHTGEADICRCFSCDIGLRDWAPGDVPLEEHAKYSPSCSYLRQLKGDSFIQMVQHGHASGMQNGASKMNNGNYDVSSRVTTAMNGLKLEEHGSRKADFNIFRSEAVRSVVEMGYSEDVVRRVIRKLHTKGKPNPTVEDILDIILDYENEDTSNSSELEHLQTGHLDKSHLLNENARLKESVLCMECHSGEKNILFLPCAHLCMCDRCARDVDQCPQCDNYIRERIRTYMS